MAFFVYCRELPHVRSISVIRELELCNCVFLCLGMCICDDAKGKTSTTK